MTGLPAQRRPPAAVPAVVILADGQPGPVRPVEPAGQSSLASAFDARSDESRYRPFFTLLHQLSPANLVSDRWQRLDLGGIRR